MDKALSVLQRPDTVIRLFHGTKEIRQVLREIIDMGASGRYCYERSRVTQFSSL